MRSVPVHRVLHGGAKKFASSEGVATDYELSAPTEQIDYFLSHSWRASRMHKYLTLWMFFRLPAATAGAVLFSLLAFVLTLTDVLPPMTSNFTERFDDLEQDGEGGPVSLWASLSAIVGFFAGAMIQGMSERHLSKGKGCFLDKLCIHQTDVGLKKQGIRSIGLFLRRSDQMFILWSPEYFTRLWCCFEVAAFEKGAREDSRDVSRHITFRPVQIGPFLAICYQRWHRRGSETAMARFG